MLRERIFFKLKSASAWNEALKLIGEINSHARERGWAEATVWTQTVGPFNELVLELDHPDLATYEKERAAQYADEQMIGFFMQIETLAREHAGHNELWERAEPVAGS